MKLSDLVRTLNQIQQAEFDSSFNTITGILNNVWHSLSSTPVRFDNNDQRLMYYRQNVDKNLSHIRSEIDYLKHHIIEKIKQIEPKYFAASLDLWRNEIRYESVDWILNRRLSIDNDSNIKLLGKIRANSHWQHPGLILRPAREQHIEYMVPLDPLYIVDREQALIDPTFLQFTSQYQQRLRRYFVDNQEHQDPLWELPTSQFGFIFAYNYLNYYPMEMVNNYVRSFGRLLKPGGVAIFTFNDCDAADAVMLTEQNFMCYTPGRYIELQAEKLGLEVVERWTGQGITWLEIRQPGTLTSLRGSQTMAKIVAH